MKRSTPAAIKARELTVLALLAALMIALQVAMSSLPNIEPVTLLMILATLHMRWKTMLSVAVFVLVEGLVYGFGIWFLGYLYVWPLLVVLVMALRRWSHWLLWTVVAGVFGLLFGTLFSLPYFITGGWAAGVAYIAAGLPFDLTHCLSNIAVTALLFRPLDRVMARCLRRA